MKVTFLLPGVCRHRPVGGYKMVYLYANALAARGWDVELAYYAFFPMPGRRLRALAGAVLRYPWRALTGYYRHVDWFQLDPRVTSRYLWSFSRLKPEAGRAYVATAMQTVAQLRKSGVPMKQVAYYIQGYENWYFSDEEVSRSYQAGMHNVVISEWLKEVVEKSGAEAEVIHNGFDPSAFFCETPPAERAPQSVAMLYHTDALKGCDDGIACLVKLKEKFPSLQATLFGFPERPTTLPSWIKYAHRPVGNTLRSLYNAHAVYLAPSHSEGWGLTVGEAMLSGCAVVCTDTGGFLEMAHNERNALVVARKDVAAMTEAVARLMTNNELRLRFAEQAQTDILRFTIASSTDKWERVLTALCGNNKHG